jgi:hypothetical protein
VEDDGKVAEELKRADAVVLTYACDEPSTLERLSTFWLPKLRKLEVFILHCHSVFKYFLFPLLEGRLIPGHFFYKRRRRRKYSYGNLMLDFKIMHGYNGVPFFFFFLDFLKFVWHSNRWSHLDFDSYLSMM